MLLIFMGADRRFGSSYAGLGGLGARPGQQNWAAASAAVGLLAGLPAGRLAGLPPIP